MIDNNDSSAKMKSAKSNVRVPLITVSCLIVFALVAVIALKPDQTMSAISTVQGHLLSVLGPFLELFAVIVVIVTLYFALGKYRNVKLGEGKPEYTTFSYIAMMFMASMASAAVYWAFTEWVYYYEAPGICIEPRSTEALEAAIGYQFFHWGPYNSLYLVTAVGIAYAYYIRKVKILQPGATCEAMLGNMKHKGIITKIIDFIIVFATVGGLGVTLGAAIPLVSGGLKQVFGIETNFAVQVGIIVFITIIFTITSCLGTQKGMQVVSNLSAYICFAILGYILIVGPTEFILKNAVNSLGFAVNNLPRMMLWTDPVENTGFVESWTIFFIAFFTSYCGLMGTFIAKVSKGRTLGEMTICAVGGLIFGTVILFGVLGSYSISAFLRGLADPIEIVLSGQGEAGIYQIIATLPFGDKIVPFAILLMTLGFVVSSLDTASLGLAQTTTRTVDEEGNASNGLRVFWCIILALVPLSLMFVGAGFDAVKTIAIIVATPFIFVIGFMIISVFRWLKEDSQNGVLQENRLMYEREKAEWAKEKEEKKHKKERKIEQ